MIKPARIAVGGKSGEYLVTCWERLLACFCPCHQHARVIFVVGPTAEHPAPVRPTPEYLWKLASKGSVSVATTMKASQQTTLRVKRFLDRKGNPATVDGAPKWSTDNSEVLALTPDADGMSCVVAAVGPLGTATITLRADADMGPDEKEIVGSVEFTVNAGDAVVVEIEEEAPVEQP